MKVTEVPTQPKEGGNNVLISVSYFLDFSNNVPGSGESKADTFESLHQVNNHPEESSSLMNAEQILFLHFCNIDEFTSLRTLQLGKTVLHHSLRLPAVTAWVYNSPEKSTSHSTE